MQQGTYIFNNENAFIDAIATLENQYNIKINQSQTVYLKKHFNSIKEVRKEINFLNGFVLNCFQGFRKANLIKANITGVDGVNYSITYSFNNSSDNNGCFGRLHHYFRKREQTYI